MMSLKDFLSRKIRNAAGTAEMLAAVEDIRNFADNKLKEVIAEGKGLIPKALSAQMEAHTREVVRSQILNRWKVVDAMAPLLYPPDFEVTCRICGHSAEKKTYETKVSHCIFNGGKLERFVCPECGCIFGPLKMFALNPRELADEYKQHYSVFDEGDSHESELLAFRQIDQGREGKIYLNYGAGRWSKSSRLLREQGYTVYDYDPFAPDGGNQFLLSSREEMKKIKFDGIFSNNVIEHFFEPVEELAFLRTLLRDERSLMGHATCCYDYDYAFTRFHTFFFTGKSLDVIAEKNGMTVSFASLEKPLLFENFKIALFRIHRS